MSENEQKNESAEDSQKSHDTISDENANTIQAEEAHMKPIIEEFLDMIGGKKWGIQEWSTGNALLEIQAVLANNDPNWDSQRFYIFKLDDDKCLLTNKMSGLSLSEYTIRRPRFAEHQKNVNVVIQSETQSVADPDSLSWVICDSVTIPDYFTVKNVKNNLYMTSDEDLTLGPAILKELLCDSRDMLSQIWRFPEGPEIIPEIMSALVLNCVDDIERLTSFSCPEQAKTEETLIGYVNIPFPMVYDYLLTNRQKSDQSPFYILRRYGFLQQDWSYEHNGDSDLTKTATFTVGLLTNNKEAIEKTIGISVIDEDSFGFVGICASIRQEITSALMVSDASTTTTAERSKTESFVREYPKGKRISEAIWNRKDRYVLIRKDGSEVLDWITGSSKDTIIDSYSNDAN